MLGNPENKPAFLSDKNLEPCLRFLSRRFPNVDIKASAVCTSPYLASLFTLNLGENIEKKH